MRWFLDQIGEAVAPRGGVHLVTKESLHSKKVFGVRVWQRTQQLCPVGVPR